MAVNLSQGDPLHVAVFSDGCVQWFYPNGKAKDLPHDLNTIKAYFAETTEDHAGRLNDKQETEHAI